MIGFLNKQRTDTKTQTVKTINVGRVQDAPKKNGKVTNRLEQMQNMKLTKNVNGKKGVIMEKTAEIEHAQDCKFCGADEFRVLKIHDVEFVVCRCCYKTYGEIKDAIVYN